MLILEKITARKMARDAMKGKKLQTDSRMFESLYGEFHRKHTIKIIIFGFLLGNIYDLFAIMGFLPTGPFGLRMAIMFAVFGYIIGQRYKQIKKDIFYHR